MGKKPINRQRNDAVSIPLPPDVLAWLNEESRRREMPRAALVRAWVTREMDGQMSERLGRLNSLIVALTERVEQQAAGLRALTAQIHHRAP